ncbi:MAG: hypothetical protein IK077_09545 [Thermoguttaceae bacterium]|nr:hypothetical protein [Thermoguttaceae bacterium]
MKTKLFFFLMALLTLITSSALKGEEPVPESSYVEQLRQTADKMEVFPIDFIARDGPLSYFNKENKPPCFYYRYEIDFRSFELFYNFCQLAFNATPEDINLCVDYIPQASTKEKALILTVFYIYSFPWEKQRLVDREAWEEAAKSRSWLSLQYPAGVFDVSIREKYHSQRGDISPRLLSIIAEYVNEDEIAFPSCDVEPRRMHRFKNKSEAYEHIKSLKDKSGRDGEIDEYFTGWTGITKRKNVLRKMSEKYPREIVHEVIACNLYASYCWDMYVEELSNAGPFACNGSENPKSLGQIAQELMESWDPPQMIDVQTISGSESQE